LQKFKFMATKEDVEQFLRQLKTKINVFGILYRDDRGKNAQTLAELDITPKYRDSVILSITADDYSEGPILDVLNDFGEMWVFGKDVKNREVYIKIALGAAGTNTICISFHIAEHPINYPFK